MRILSRIALPAAILLTLGLVIFHQLALTDHILGRGDTYTYFYPYWAARDAALRAGTLPLWTPDLLMGAPLLANPQLGTFYPPNWLTVRLAPPDALRISILLHSTWATLGAYVLACRSVQLGRGAAIIAAAAFGLGGYLGAHVEQINQLQGLSWLPWLFILLHDLLTRQDRRGLAMLGLAVALALQFMAGHTQTVFISGVGLGLYTLAAGRPRGVMWIAGAGIIALLLAAPQLIPTLELISVSGRSGGLTPNAALSFSFDPFIAARGLLPSYAGKLFGEYIAYIGVGGLLLAGGGAAARPDVGAFPHRRVWLVMVAAGLLLALGAYNPLNWWLVRLPGFDLFRVPARWLALYALGVAMLAGLGFDALARRARVGRVGWRIVGGVPLLLFGASFLAARVPEQINGPATPTAFTLAAWALAFAAMLAIWWGRRWSEHVLGGAVAVVVLELVAASWVMPYNDLVPPGVWDDHRFTISQMQAYTATTADGLTADDTPPGRLLSISGLFFDPGDQDTLRTRYDALGMTPLEQRYSFVGAKLKETLSPNLPLAWGIPSVDGFGGGLLPTRYYVEFADAVYPTDSDPAVDGRLRENLALAACRGACLPPSDVLDMMGVRYLLVDKVFDAWYEGVAFDTTFTLTEAASDRPFLADALHLLAACPAEAACTAPAVTLHGADDTRTVRQATITALDNGWRRFVFALDEPSTQQAITIQASDAEIIGASWVDTRHPNQFAALHPPHIERVLSSDIKLYQRQPPPARAIIGSESGGVIRPLPGGDVRFRVYQPGRIELDITHTIPDAALLLRDSYYPGWTATVNGDPTPVYRANVNFRAISLPTGASHVIFNYKPIWLPGIFIVGGITWVFVSVTCIYLWRRP